MYPWQQTRDMDHLRRRSENLIAKANGPIAQSAASCGHRPPANESHKLDLQDGVGNTPGLGEMSGGSDK